MTSIARRIHHRALGQGNWRRRSALIVAVGLGAALLFPLQTADAAFDIPACPKGGNPDSACVVAFTPAPNGAQQNPLDTAYDSVEKLVYSSHYGPTGAVPGGGRLYVVAGETLGFGSFPDGTVIGSLDLGISRPTQVEVNPNTRQVYVPLNWTNELAIIKGGRVDGFVFEEPYIERKIYLGFGVNPVWAKVNRVTNKVYVPRPGPKDVAVINGTTKSTEYYLPIDDNGQGIAVDEVNNRIFVGRPAHNDIVVINGNNNTIIGYVYIGAPTMHMDYNPSTGKLYAANPCATATCEPNAVDNPWENSVSVVNMNPAGPGSYAYMYRVKAGIGVNPFGVAVNPAINRVYVGSPNSKQLSVIDGNSDGVGVMARTAPGTAGMSVDTATDRVFVASQGIAGLLGSGSPPSLTFFQDLPPRQPVGHPSHFFGEGTTRPGFQSYLTLYVPDVDDTVEVKYLLGPGQGGPVTKQYQIVGGTRATVDINAEVGPDKDVSMQVRSLRKRPFFAERVMYFNNVVVGSTEGTASPGDSNFWTDHAETYTERFFAEGTTRPGFSEWLTLYSPNHTQTVTATFLFGPGQGAPMNIPIDLVAGERKTIHVNDIVGPGKDVSVKLVSPSNRPFHAERPMYFDQSAIGAQGGHNGLGLPRDPFTDTIFAEGNTRPGFRSFLTMFSEHDQKVMIWVYPGEQQDGRLLITDVMLPANERITMDYGAMKSEYGAMQVDRDISLRVISCGNFASVCDPNTAPANPIPFYAERPMYFANVSVGATGGTVNNPGSLYTGIVNPRMTDHYLAEGTNRRHVENFFDVVGEFQTYVTMISPDITNTVDITLGLGPGQSPVQASVALPKQQRVTVDLSFLATFLGGENVDFSIRAQSSIGEAFYIERPMYFRNMVNGASGGTISSGNST